MSPPRGGGDKGLPAAGGVVEILKTFFGTRNE